ncbi:hypothetical protein [Paraburkholderia aromaticivorans]|uniref:hypothetical protein n=1 Tax=Paraburkholderia aromaticivorans TaxID=2026199 RepID=UPI001455E223|nr:hypothetical protein [Paraburkholderia aromaticivorans]
MKKNKTPPLAPEFPNAPGAQAAWRLFEACQHIGSTYPIASFLTSLYNAHYARPDAFLLCRRIGDDEFDDVMAVMKWFREARPGGFDLHYIFGSTGDAVMFDLMDRFGYWPLSNSD